MAAALAAFSKPHLEPLPYIARSGEQGEVHIAKGAQGEALRALDESSGPGL